MNKSHILKFLSVLLDICQFYWPFRWASIFALLIFLCWLSTFNLIDLCCSVFVFCLLISGFLDLDFKSLCLSAFMFLSVSVCLSIHLSYAHTAIIYSVSLCVHAHSIACVWKSEDNLLKVVLSFHHVTLRDQNWWSGLLASVLTCWKSCSSLFNF